MEIYPFLPQTLGFRCVGMRIEPDHVTLELISTFRQAFCPACGRPAQRIHSRYARTLADLPWMGTAVRLHLGVRRFFCDTPTCPQQTFAERLPGVAAAHARKTCRLAQVLVRIGLSDGGEAGARLSVHLAMPTSGDTILRLIHRTPVPTGDPLSVLGVDDWAWRKGQRYGTILCDLERHQVVDLLPERSADTLAFWLKIHPGISLISRDRGGYYAQGARQGAPQARQVADRFHLLCNLREVLVRLLDRHIPDLREAARIWAEAPPPPTASGTGPEPVVERLSLTRAEQAQVDSRARRQERYEQVIALHRQGTSIRQIARQMGMHRQTVRRFLNAGQLPERASRRYPRRTDPFVDHLGQRWQEGCRNARQLTQELREQGFHGSYYMVRRRIAAWRRTDDPPTRGPKAKPSSPKQIQRPSSRRVAWLLLGAAEDQSNREQAFLACLWKQCPQIKRATELAQEFIQMVRERRVERLADWMLKTHGPEVPRELGVFADGLQQDVDAIRAALSLEWSNGQVEGQINRLKLIKRQMYGRAGFELLRRRVLKRV